MVKTGTIIGSDVDRRVSSRALSGFDRLELRGPLRGVFDEAMAIRPVGGRNVLTNGH